MPEISVRDDARETEILAPWFLHTLNALTKTSKRKEILKIEIFDKVSLNAFKANPEKLKKYVGMKGSQEYYEIVELVVNYLEKNGYVTTEANPAKISITEEGINKCGESSDSPNSWNSKYYPVYKDDLSKEGAYTKYR